MIAPPRRRPGGGARPVPTTAACGALAALLLAPAWPAGAQEWVPRQTAQLQALDKVTARVSVFDARVGQPARFDTLTIVVRACHARPPDEVPDAAAWMEITDSRAAPGAPPAFRGWMFANAPGVHMLEHPVYDIRVLACR
ncbi:DUF2155 domain-containing protein [Caldovatus aquaticus]|uniref:DUF2155 domain-containing protein n=1 Tax=Caldovatus aquaticus TaxID=2865671 RepID=A0ABS7F6M3_9PROT|nr:DUF2155 domain-containing protein [Caldovatus aquaticus]MBW8271271.1 DUF2155 domain-containing protein [Caldovatus aquaticus]